MSGCAVKQCGANRLEVRRLIISHRHRFIFMHCRKVAGSSIAAALAPHLGPDDLHLGTWPEAWAAGVAPNRRARTDLMHPMAGASFIARFARRPTRWRDPAWTVAALNGAQRLKYRRQLGQSPEHAYAVRVREFDPEAWRDYFKFCFVRNPYDRAVSDWRWRTAKRAGSGPELAFGDYLEALRRHDFSHRAIPRHWNNWPLYTIDDRIAVDFVGRFEQLERDLRRVFERIGLPPPKLPHAKNSGRRRPYASWYGNTERAQVSELFGPEIAQFGYSFDENETA